MTNIYLEGSRLIVRVHETYAPNRLLYSATEVVEQPFRQHFYRCVDSGTRQTPTQLRQFRPGLHDARKTLSNESASGNIAARNHYRLDIHSIWIRQMTAGVAAAAAVAGRIRRASRRDDDDVSDDVNDDVRASTKNNKCAARLDGPKLAPFDKRRR